MQCPNPPGPINLVGSYIEITIIQWEQRGFSAMPMKLTTTIRKVQTIPNPKNIGIVNDFLDW